VGVDVERIRPRPSAARIAHSRFAAAEQAALAARGPRARQAAFHRCWAAKEAYAKGIGRGLAAPFGEFSVASALRSAGGVGPVEAGWSVSVETRDGRHLGVALEDRGG